MSACITPPASTPIIALTLVGSGEPLLRLEKRLHCAVAGAGVRLDFDIRKMQRRWASRSPRRLQCCWRGRWY